MDVERPLTRIKSCIEFYLYLSIYLTVDLFIHLSIYLSTHLSIFLSICVDICDPLGNTKYVETTQHDASCAVYMMAMLLQPA